jgi:hypothetical protein
MKPIEIVLRSGGERKGRTMQGINLTKVYCKHICKYYSVPLVLLLYINKKDKNTYDSSVWYLNDWVLPFVKMEKTGRKAGWSREENVFVLTISVQITSGRIYMFICKLTS